MKNLKLVFGLFCLLAIVFSSCTKEKIEKDLTHKDQSSTPEFSIEAIENNPNLQTFDIDNLPNGFELIEDTAEDGADYRSCCAINEMYFYDGNPGGRISLIANVAINPNSGFYLFFFVNGSGVEYFQFFNSRNTCARVRINIPIYGGYPCAGLSAEAMMFGPGFSPCANEEVFCNL